jgi:hypothetical protein
MRSIDRYDEKMSSRRRRGLRPLALLALLTAALAVAVAFSSIASVRPAGGAIAVEVVPVPLDPTEPSRDRLGPLVYLGGLWLRANDRDRRFGGLSDLRVSADGSRAYIVSDCGEGLTARLSYDPEGRLVHVDDVQVFPLATGPSGGFDSESLVMGEDSLEVGFEGRPKILAYRKDPPFAGPPRALPVPRGVARCESNGGLETMADVGEGRRLLVCEARRRPSSTVPAWIGRGGEWTQRDYPLAFEGGWAGEPFRPTGAVLLPHGDVLVVERRFPPQGARIVRLDGASLNGEGPLEPREIARFEAPLTLDNFEGIDARRDASGRTLVYLISDDNNCFKNGFDPIPQRTLLLMFALEG